MIRQSITGNVKTTEQLEVATAHNAEAACLSNAEVLINQSINDWLNWLTRHVVGLFHPPAVIRSGLAIVAAMSTLVVPISSLNSSAAAEHSIVLVID